jgi:hypothetical protein
MFSCEVISDEDIPYAVTDKLERKYLRAPVCSMKELFMLRTLYNLSFLYDENPTPKLFAELRKSVYACNALYG